MKTGDVIWDNKRETYVTIGCICEMYKYGSMCNECYTFTEQSINSVKHFCKKCGSLNGYWTKIKTN